MRYIGFDMGDGESAVAAFEHGSLIEPVILPVCGSASLLSAVGLLGGEIVVGDRALTDALAQELSVRFKSRFTTDPASYEDVVRFVRGVLSDLRQSGALRPDDRFVVGERDLVLTGGDGGDVYAFAVPSVKRDGTLVVQITDFSVGDYIDLVRYALFDEQSATGRPLAEALRGGTDAPPGIQYRLERLDGRDCTVVSADLDHDDAYETTVVLDGEHALRFSTAQFPEPPTLHN